MTREKSSGTGSSSFLHTGAMDSKICAQTLSILLLYYLFLAMAILGCSATLNGGPTYSPCVSLIGPITFEVPSTGDRDDANAPGEPSANLPVDGARWVDVFVKEMTSATGLEDSRARATRVLKFFEQSISGQAGAETVKSLQKENMMLKEQMEAVLLENTILKRAVAIQHERQMEHEDKNRELQHLKQLVSQYQEQLKST